MIIKIDDKLFNELKEILKDKNSKIHEQLEEVTVFDDIKINSLEYARKVKTQRVKQEIKNTIVNLIEQNINPTKYQVHKKNNIAYVTLNKYYDDILDEVQNKL